MAFGGIAIGCPLCPREPMRPHLYGRSVASENTLAFFAIADTLIVRVE
jgi:hypothetical protein